MKLDTGTELPDNLELTQEFTDTFNLINNTNTNLFITGKAGSGKSTLLRCISRLAETTAGKIYIDGIDLLKLNNNIPFSLLNGSIK